MPTAQLLLAAILVLSRSVFSEVQPPDALGARAAEGAAAMNAGRFQEAMTIYDELASARVVGGNTADRVTRRDELRIAADE